MEGVGARLGRSSTRYGPTTVFSGPVRKWKKKWVHVSPPNASSNHHHHHHSQISINGSLNGNNNGSRLLLYKWTPITQSQNNNDGSGGGEAKTSAKDDDAAAAATEAEVQLPRRKFKYVPVAVLEEQKEEAAEQMEDETKPSETDIDAAEPTPKNDGFDEKPDINDVPMEESQAQENDPPAAEARQDLNESTLDLSLGLNAHDGDDDSDMKTDKAKDSQLEIKNSSSVVGT